MGKSLIKILSLALFITLIASGSQAALVTVSPTGTYAYTIGGPSSDGNVDLQSIKANTGDLFDKHSISQGTVRTFLADVVTGDDQSGLIQHIRPKGVGMKEHYLSVFSVFGIPGKAVFKLDAGYNNFSFTWGSIDTYNEVEVTNGNKQTYVITGADVIKSMANIKEGSSSRHFSLTDMSGLVKIVLRSTSNAFEVANVSISSVPLPAALPLLCSALFGIAGLRRKKAS